MKEGSFLYYLPGLNWESVKPETLAKHPILSGPFFEHIHSPRMFNLNICHANIIDRGPDGGAGVIIAPQPQVDTGQNYGFSAAQTWRKFSPEGFAPVWIGWQADMLPGPDSLRRAQLIDGYEVELGDGRVWIAPVIRPFHEDRALGQQWGCSLPMLIGVDEKFEHVARVIDRYREAWDVTGRIADVLFNGDGSSQFAFFDDAVSCLTVNYRIGKAEATVLELLQSSLIEEVCGAAVDNPMVDQYLEAQKSRNPT